MPVHPIRDTDNVVEIGYCDPSVEDIRKVVAPFDITKTKRCPYCNSTDIEYSSVFNNWICNYCYEIWEE